MTGRSILVVSALLVAQPAEAPEDRLAPHMAILGLTLMHSTFEDAQRLLGRMRVRHNQGDAAASADASCLTGKDGTTLALVSNREMAKGATLTSYQLLERPQLADFSGGTGTGYVVPVDARPRCSPLERLSRATATGGGLRLGMTRAEVLAVLGEPTDDHDDVLVFVTKQQTPYLARVLRVELLAGVAVAIRAEPDR